MSRYVKEKIILVELVMPGTAGEEISKEITIPPDYDDITGVYLHRAQDGNAAIAPSADVNNPFLNVHSDFSNDPVVGCIRPNMGGKTIVVTYRNGSATAFTAVVQIKIGKRG